MININKELKIKNGKLVRVEAIVKEGIIQSIKISGDFFLYPEEAIFLIEQNLLNLAYQKSLVENKLNQLVKTNKWQLVGIDVKSIIALLF
jgi:lipoate-protein ligase A